MGCVNAVCNTPSFKYVPNKCSRYCEEHGCKHTIAKRVDEKIMQKSWVSQLYIWNIKVLGKLPCLSYRQANIAVYFLAYPFLIFVLLYRLLK